MKPVTKTLAGFTGYRAVQVGMPFLVQLKVVHKLNCNYEDHCDKTIYEETEPRNEMEVH